VASIPVIETTVSTETKSPTDDDDFVNVVTTEDLTDGTTYYVICSAIVGGNAGYLPEWRLVDETQDVDVVLSNSTTIRDPQQSGKPQSYYYIGRFTAGSDGGGLSFQQKGFIGTGAYRPAVTDFLSMLLIDLSNLTSDDFFFANDTIEDDNSETMANRVIHTQTGIVTDDNWLVFGWIATEINDITFNTEAVMVCDDATPASEPFVSFEGENTSEALQWWMCRAYTLSNSTVEWKMQSRDSAGGDASRYMESTLLGLRMSAFLDSSQSYTNGTTSAPDTNFYELATSTFTPSISGSVIVVATSVYDAGGTTRKSNQRIQKDGITIPNTQPDTEAYCNSNDATDELPLSYITTYTGVEKESAVIDYDVKTNNIVSAWEDYTLAVFSTEIREKGKVRYSAEAGEIFSAGQQESETYSAGQQASEITG